MSWGVGTSFAQIESSFLRTNGGYTSKCLPRTLDAVVTLASVSLTETTSTFIVTVFEQRQT